ncbi:unnamed protein product [Orchesella dallaii]|uniref:Uncharacterized protein n=1 Tax=Orchesella dallaii TaxID=48710 RepID=A0ABP1RMT4_9HEXA
MEEIQHVDEEEEVATEEDEGFDDDNDDDYVPPPRRDKTPPPPILEVRRGIRNGVQTFAFATILTSAGQHTLHCSNGTFIPTALALALTLAITHPPKSISSSVTQCREVSMDVFKDECFTLASSALPLPRHSQIVNHQSLWAPDTPWKSKRI